MESLMLSAITQADLLYVLNLAKNLGLVAVMLGFVIFVHELGHFLVAKACGVKCEKFYIGFNFFPIPLGFVTIPATLFKVQWGETEYGIGSFPLGGYVKMLGQDDDPRNAEAEAERTKAIAEGTAAEGLVSGTSVEKTTQEGLTQDSTEKSGEATTQSKFAKAVKDARGNTVLLDPRSYPAKSVPQRMAIISAGVIMNIIFGCIFAAIAYRNGVEIQPAVIGTTAAGDPAWKANLKSGDRLLQVGKNGTPNEHMRFVKDMSVNLALYGEFDKDLEVLVRHADGETESVTMRPSDRHRNSKQMSRPTLGLSSGRSTTFAKVSPAMLPLLGRDLTDIGYTEEKETIKLEGYDDLQAAMQDHSELSVKLVSKFGVGDKLLAIDDQPVASYADIQRLLAAHPSQKIKLTIERAPKKSEKDAPDTSAASAPERYTLEVAPRPAVDYGVEMEASPIVAVQKNSPAAEAGLTVGDRLVSFAGEPIGDPLAFPQQTLAKVGETVTVVFERGGEGKKESRELSVKLRAPPQTVWSGTSSNMLGVETMGIAYEVTTKVAKVVEGGPAAGKLQPGDQILSVQFLPAGAAEEAVEGALFKKPAVAKEPLELDGKIAGWPRVIEEASTHRLRSTRLVVTARRGGEQGEEIKVELMPRDSTSIFMEERSLPFDALEEMHTAGSWGEAFSLGAREVKERMMEVFTVVTKLVTGRISPTNLGGPLAIIDQARNEADQGISDLLMFFTFLSANLAVINFLPIPALDGGHMVFLAYEGIRRKPVDENLQMRLSAAGILSLLALMLFVTMLDLYRFFG